MKTHLRLVPLFSLFIVSLLISSCDKDELNPEFGLTNRTDAVITYSADMVNVGDSVTVTFDAGNDADCGHIQIQVDGPDANGWVQVVNPVEPDSGIAVYAFAPSLPGEYNFRAKYTRTGNPASCDFESTGWVEAETLLIVEGDSMPGDTISGDTIVGDSCENFFGGEVTCDSTAREVVFTYVSDEDLNYLKIQGGLTNGVEEDAVITVTGADFDISQHTPGNSSNRIIKLEGSVVACDTITITVQWNSTNNGTLVTGDWSAGELVLESLECD